LLHRLWSGRDVTAVGRGRVIAGRNVEAALQLIGVAPDMEVERPQADSHILFVHRHVDDTEIYFVSNRNNRASRLDVRFRVSGKAPEIWRADTGAMAPASYRIEGGLTTMSLSFEAEESYFVVFRRPATEPSRSEPAVHLVSAAHLDGPWEVTFQPGRGAPAATTIPNLVALNDNPDPGIKYFSGIATYTTTFTAPQDLRPEDSLLIDLGQIGDLADVRVNGQEVGAAWHAPYRVDIGSVVKPGINQVEIRVANLWVNRLIGDAQPGAQKFAYTVMPTYTAAAPLRPAGLIGPVQLFTAKVGQARSSNSQCESGNCRALP
jgi:hypothetical protein